MVNDILFALWFFLPAGIANMVPVFAARVPSLAPLKVPLDFGKSWRNKRIFGQNKSWLGLASGVVAATLTLWLQQYAAAHVGWIGQIADTVDYATLPVLLLGFLFGVGTLGGDAIESFFKRQKGVAPGRSWFPFDQIDFIVGAAIATAPIVVLSLGQYLWVTVLWAGASLAASAIGYLLGLKERPI